MAFAYADKNIVWVLAIGGYKKLKLFFLYLPEHSGKSAGGTHCYICAVGTCDGYLHFVVPALIRKIVRVYLGFVFRAVF